MRTLKTAEDADPDPARVHVSTEISLQNPNNYAEVRPAELRPWLESLLTELAPDRNAFGVRFVGDRAIREMNRRYRGRDYATDVLSFPGGDAADAANTPEDRYLGDVAISVPTARRQAAERQEPVERELRSLLLHGVLHCLGHDHETDDGEMERLEARLRQRWLAAESRPLTSAAAEAGS